MTEITESIYSKIIKTTKTVLQTVDGNKETIEHGLGPKTLSDFFTSKDRTLEIPSYQRPYTWDSENIDDLIKDIENLKENEDSSWFLGSIFITTDDPKSNKIHLLDGQQRITTIQILIWQLCVVQKHISYILTSFMREEIKQKDETLIQLFNSYRSQLEMVLKGNKKENLLPLPRFLLRNEISQIWKDFIQQIDKIDNFDEAKSFIENKFNKELEKKYKEGFPSADNIKDAYYHISKILDKKFYNSISQSHKSESLSLESLIREFNIFSNSLLNKIWLIEIELIHANDSLKIFEGINNRGKGLSLTDKLRFKCLINLKDEDNKILVRDLWRRAYSLIQYNKEKGFLKGEDDFFTYLLISISKIDLGDERDKVRFFEENFIFSNPDKSASEESIVDFCEKMILILSHLKSLNEFNDHNFVISRDITPRDRIEQAQAFYALFRKVIHYSDNSRFLYFSLIYNSGISSIAETNNLVLTGMMNIIKTVFHFEVFKKIQSNAVRTLYLGIVKKVNGSMPGDNNSRLFYKLYKDLKDNYLDYQFEEGEFEINASDIINNFVPGNDSNKDILILYFYNYHSRFDDLRNQIQSYKKQETHLEHILPQNWRSKWEDYGEFDSNDVIDEIKILNHDFNFINSWINLLSEKGDRLKLVHDDLKKNQKHPKESLGQWIGNKLVTHQKVNSTVSNNSWPQKKIGLQATSFIKIPSENLPNVGINNFEDFDYKSIIKRTIYIVDFTLGVLNSKEHGTWEPYHNN